MPPDGIPPPDGQSIVVAIDSDGVEPKIDPDTGVIEIPTEDGGVVVDLNPEREPKDTEFDENLAMHMGDSELNLIGDDLMRGIDADESSRAEWLAIRERGLELLGWKLDEPRGGMVALEGMATIRHPVLSEAVIRAQATACGELLPAFGPVKVNDLSVVSSTTSDLAEALEKDLNDYLTNRAKEYYPDTRRALLWSSFGGCSFKKVYNCPLRQRPISETVDAKDLIVSAAATDLTNAERVTHQIVMRQSTLKRMQLAEVYRDVTLSQPSSQPGGITAKEAATEGLSVHANRPEDAPYIIYECYCELDLDEYAPEQFKGKKIPLPYRVTIEKDNRTVLEVRRNWDEDDDRCLARRVFVKYPYIEGFGIYGLGLLHILGNPASALTGAWRIMMDNGMFANFPGGIVDRAAARQEQNELRIPPGGWVKLDFGGRTAAQVYGQLPYRDLGSVWAQFIQHLEEVAQRLGSAAEVNVGDGRQDAPVGTTIALIEQATKIESEVHKGLHTAQAEEFQLLKLRFMEDPSAFWRHIKKSKVLPLLMQQSGFGPVLMQQDSEDDQRNQKFVAALNTVELVPHADPNSPSHTHRILKWQGLKQLAVGNPNIDMDEVDKMGVRILGFSPENLWKPPTEQPQMPDPKMISAQAQMIAAQAKLVELQHKQQGAGVDAQIEQQKLEVQKHIADMQVLRERIIHQNDERKAARDAMRDDVNRNLDRAVDANKQRMDMARDLHKHRTGLEADIQKHRGGLIADLHKHHTNIASEHHQNAADREAELRKHQTALAAEHYQNAVDREAELHKHHTALAADHHQSEADRAADQRNQHADRLVALKTAEQKLKQQRSKTNGASGTD